MRQRLAQGTGTEPLCRSCRSGSRGARISVSLCEAPGGKASPNLDALRIIFPVAPGNHRSARAPLRVQGSQGGPPGARTATRRIPHFALALVAFALSRRGPAPSSQALCGILQPPSWCFGREFLEAPSLLPPLPCCLVFTPTPGAKPAPQRPPSEGYRCRRAALCRRVRQRRRLRAGLGA